MLILLAPVEVRPRVVPEVRAMVLALCRAIAPAALLPILTAPVLVPVFIFVSKLEEVLMLVVAPEIVAPAEPVIRLENVLTPANV
jgi:hypothetical protein